MACLGTAFAVVLNLYLKADIEHPVVVPLFEWINLSGVRVLSAPFGLYLDSLTLLWMLFVTGLGTLIALYASEYMESDVGPRIAASSAGSPSFFWRWVAWSWETTCSRCTSVGKGWASRLTC